MTLDELRKASGDKIEECTSPCRLNTTHVARGVQVVGLTGDAGFAFDAAGLLEGTVLWFEDPLAEGALKRALLSIYGAPVSETTGATRSTIWRGDDRTTIGLTVYTHLKGLALSGVFVVYRPPAKGL
ncbi:MAG: hypothetical protein FD144_2629 [Rhodospirillaceae bacterium]|nr:MAG: hypothetical protein FD144_2629 [Rhodospirillaceae bacterium]